MADMGCGIQAVKPLHLFTPRIQAEILRTGERRGSPVILSVQVAEGRQGCSTRHSHYCEEQLRLL